MLDRGDDALALYAPNELNSHSRGEIRVFPKILEVAAVHRGAVDVNARAGKRVHAAGPRVPAYSHTDTMGEIRVPRRGQRDAARVSGARSPHADTHGPVRHLDPGQADFGDRTNEKVVYHAEKIYLLFESQLGEHGVNPAVNFGGHGLPERTSRQARENGHHNQHRHKKGASPNSKPACGVFHSASCQQRG